MRKRLHGLPAWQQLELVGQSKEAWSFSSVAGWCKGSLLSLACGEGPEPGCNGQEVAPAKHLNHVQACHSGVLGVCLQTRSAPTPSG